MKERKVLILKLIASHIFLVPFVLILIYISNIPWFPAIFIPQTILVILFLAGYWEFFGIRARFLICLIGEVLLFVTFLAALSSEHTCSGKAGNSGMSERPHIHMQLMKCEGDDYWKGLGISMQFRGKNLYKNRLIRN